MAIIPMITAAATLATLWILGTIVYRLYFHSLAGIPGPKLAATTYWYECYFDVIQPGRYPFKIKELHLQYGPVLRVNPHEVHINDVGFLDTIYAIRNRDDPTAAGALLVPESIGGAKSFALHKLRRDALNPYFTAKNVISLESMLREKTDKLSQCFDKAMAAGTPINLSDANFAFSNDIVKSFCFGSDENLLNDMEKSSIMRQNLAELLRGIHLNGHFGWALGILAKLMPNATPKGLLDLLQFKAKTRVDIQNMFNDESEKQQQTPNSVFRELKNNPDLPPAEKTLSRLADEGTLLVMAGTESPAKSITIAQYYLLANPAILSTLRASLAELPPNPTLHQLAQSPYLTAVLAEANRLSFGVTKRLARTCPTQSLSYPPYTFPPGTWLSTLSLIIHTNETIFPDPWAFKPERWLGAEGAERKRYLFAFGRGHRKCLGVNLAEAEMCLAVVAAAKYDMELFETDEGDVRFQHDYQISHPRLDSKGVRAIVKRKVG